VYELDMTVHNCRCTEHLTWLPRRLVCVNSDGKLKLGNWQVRTSVSSAKTWKLKAREIAVVCCRRR